MLAGNAWRDERGVNLLDGSRAYYGVYETADGKYMAVGALEPQFFAAMMARLGLSDFVSDYYDRSLLRDQIAEVFKTRTQAQWTVEFEDTDGCVAPVLSMRDAASDPHLTGRGTYTENAGVTQPAPAPRFSRTPSGLSTPPPTPGANAFDEVLASWLNPASA